MAKTIDRKLEHTYSASPNPPANPNYMFRGWGGQVFQKESVQMHALGAVWERGWGGDHWQHVLGHTNLFTFTIAVPLFHKQLF